MTPKSPRPSRDERLEQAAEAALRDTRWNALRTRPARLALVAALAVVVVGMIPAWVLLPSWAALLVVIVAAILWVAIRVSVRVVADLPDEFLDERQNRVRDRAYVEAYRWLSAVAVAGAAAGLVLLLLTGDGERLLLDVSFGWVQGVFWTVETLVLVLPSVILALREPGERPEG